MTPEKAKTLIDALNSARLHLIRGNPCLALPQVDVARALLEGEDREGPTDELPEVPCCPPHEQMWRNGTTKPLDNCFVCIRNERDELREVLRALLFYQQIWDIAPSTCDTARGILNDPKPSPASPAGEPKPFPAGLSRAIEAGKRHWDELGQPYPEHLQAAIDQMEAKQPKPAEPACECRETLGKAADSLRIVMSGRGPAHGGYVITFKDAEEISRVIGDLLRAYESPCSQPSGDAESVIAAFIDDHGITCDCCQHVMIDVTAAREGESQNCIAGDSEGEGVACGRTWHANWASAESCLDTAKEFIEQIAGLTTANESEQYDPCGSSEALDALILKARKLREGK